MNALKWSSFFVVILGVAVVVIISYLTPERGGQTPTASILADVNQVDTALQQYAKHNRDRYPFIGEGCVGLDILNPSLVPAYMERLPTGIYDSAAVESTTGSAAHPVYQIAINDERTAFVLLAQTADIPEAVVARAFKDDVNGDFFGCQCDEKTYCRLRSEANTEDIRL